MVKIISDNPAIEKNLKFLVDTITAEGGHLDPELAIKSENGALSVEKHGFPDGTNPLIALPEQHLLPAEGMGLYVKNDEIHMAPEKDALTPIQRQLAENMVEIYNHTSKIPFHKETCPWVTFRAAPEAMDDLLKARNLNKVQEKFANYVRGIELLDDNEVLCDSYVKTRTIGHKKFAKDKEEEAKDTQQAPEPKIMPVVDFVNHHYDGAQFNFSKGYKKDAPEREFLLLAENRPDISSRECFAFYNHLDAIDCYINYGFMDSYAPIIRSVPVELPIRDICKIKVNSYLSPWKKGIIQKNLAGLRPYIPHTMQNAPELLEVSHLIIPCGNRSPHALRRVLRLLIMNKAARALSATEVWETVLACEEIIINRNMEFYQGVAAKYSNEKIENEKNDKMANCYRQIRDIADLQLVKLSTYRFETGNLSSDSADAEHVATAAE